ncbi:DUF3822 domain-containing protein [Echinicola strongylocentroti]|uniref:DUF3822 domain-containing protein n=1 Tax=Echinicola strongylocentroti TaxID=1795355 RepID=A0A2Z4IM36_9BACT|nr:DUF3822 family protein [Echinicola strongylocentroti]AWW31638.1 DUF3822 domain-containing protein [Echinicola strongylocentroti]
MAKTVKNTHTEFHCDKLDVTTTSGLSLLFYPERLIVIVKNQNGLVIGVNDYPFVEPKELDMILQKDLFISQAGKQSKANLYIYSPDFCLVPGVMFEASEAETYLNFSSKSHHTSFFHSNLQEGQLVVVGGVDKAVLQLFTKHLPHLQLTHGSNMALSYLLREMPQMLNQEIAVVIEDSQIYLAGFANKALKFFNRFEVNSNQEFLKYSFSVLHQLAFDRMHCKITIYGNLEEISVQADVLRMYFKNIEITTPKANQNYLPGAEGFKETKKLAAFWTN